MLYRADEESYGEIGGFCGYRVRMVCWRSGGNHNIALGRHTAMESKTHMSVAQD